MITTHEALARVRARPGMHLGLGARSLVALTAFMEGIRMAGGLDPDPPYGGLVCWLECRGIPGTTPWTSLVRELGDEGALERFYELYDEYRQCRRVALFRAVLKDNKANFTGHCEPPQRPLEMIISQFAPSEAYAVAEIHLDHVLGEWSFVPTLAAAKAKARGKWNVKAKDWHPIAEDFKPQGMRRAEEP